MNRAQRRAMARHKRPGESFADLVGKKQMIAKEIQNKVFDEKVNLEVDILLQRFMWECVVALNEEFGFAEARARRYMEAIDRVQKEVEKMQEESGSQYAYEKLRQRASQITGIDIKYIHEDTAKEAREMALADGFDFPRDED